MPRRNKLEAEFQANALTHEFSSPPTPPFPQFWG